MKHLNGYKLGQKPLNIVFTYNFTLQLMLTCDYDFSQTTKLFCISYIRLLVLL